MRCRPKHLLWVFAVLTVHSAVLAEVQQAPLRILAFGDSLTEGLTSQNTRFHPYATKLQQLLQSVNPNVQVEESGVSGEQVLLSMRERLSRELREAAAQGVRYAFVLILAGINDIGYGTSADQVFHGLRRMYHACKEAGSRVVIMTNMENAGTGKSPGDAERKKLNELLREYSLRHSGPSGDLLLDLDQLLPYVSLTEAQRAEVFDDGLHLTAHGYDRMAELLADLLKPLVRAKATA